MKFEEFKNNVMVTAPKNDDKEWHLLHGIMGISTEAGELMDVMKKKLAYGKVVDIVNVKEEIGDVMWYIGYLCATQGWNLEDIMERNIEKLKVRFGDKFSMHKALNRNLEAEREVLEK